MGIIWSEFVILFNTNPPLIVFIWTLISFGFGLWYGDKRALSRYRLDKFNAVSDPIELFLTAELERLRKGKVVRIQRQLDFDALSLHLRGRERQRYKQAVNDYLSALHSKFEQNKTTGAVVWINDIPAAIDAVERLLRYARHR